jgi:hypothetical protein
LAMNFLLDDFSIVKRSCFVSINLYY